MMSSNGAECAQSQCGDGIVSPDEECDPSVDGPSGCDSNCTQPRCGNGVRGFDEIGFEEACDDGNDDCDADRC